jgi:hypothetical protein
VIVTEDLSIKGMTASERDDRRTRQNGQAKGRVEPGDPGHCAVSQCRCTKGNKPVSGNSATPGQASLVPDVPLLRNGLKKCPNVSTIAGAGSQRREIKPQPLRCWPTG